jgi:O-antigen ligase
MWLERLLWWLILGYPVLFAIADDRSVYNDRLEVGLSNPLGSLGLALQLVTLLVAAALTISRLASDASARRPLPPLAIPLILFFFINLAITLARAEPGPIFGLITSCAVLLAISLSRERPQAALLRVRSFLRLQVGLSLLLALLNPAWALVPPEHNGRSLFGLESRLIGLAAGPNYLGAAAAILCILEVLLPRRGRFFATFFFVQSIAATIWSQSRTGLVIIALGLALALSVRAFGKSHVPVIARLYTWGPIAAMFGAPLLVLTVMGGYSSEAISLTTGRVYVWSAAMEAGVRSPLFGVPRQEFTQIVALNAHGYDFLNAHNQLLETLATGGLLMVLALLMLLGAVVRGVLLQSRVALIPVALSFAVLGQLAFGTPLKLEGLSWNLASAALLVVCTLDWSQLDGNFSTFDRPDRSSLSPSRPTRARSRSVSPRIRQNIGTPPGQREVSAMAHLDDKSRQ